MDLTHLGPIMELQRKFGVSKVVDLKKPYLVVIQHPVTTEYEESRAHINETIKAIESVHMNTVWIWPNMDAGSDAISKGIRTFRERKS